MEYSSYDKRISPRLYPWWLILVGFVFGVIATLIFTASRWQPTVVYRYADDNTIWMQATMLVEQATLAANGAAFQPSLDQIFATATAIVQQAETQVGAFNGARLESDPVGDPFALTATAIVAQATQMASGS